MIKLKAFNLAVPDPANSVWERDVFFIDPHGTMRIVWRVVGGGTWNPSVQLGLPGIFSPGGGVATSLRFGTVAMDVFTVDKHGALTFTIHWADVGNPALSGTRDRIGPTHHFPPGAPVAVSPQYGIDQMDVFAVDNHGALNVAWLNPSGDWNAPIAISHAHVFPRMAGVAVSNQFGIPDQTDVFAIDREGALTVTWVVAGGAWQGPVRIGPCGRFPPGAPVAASNQFGIANQTDVFAVDHEGALNVAWVVGGGPWNGPVRISHKHVFPPGAHLAVSEQSGIGNQTDVFAIANNGGLHVSWVNGAGSWHGPAQIGSACHFCPGAPLAASSRSGIPGQTDVFVSDDEGALNDAWVVGGGTWHGPVRIGPPIYPNITVVVLGGAPRLVEVTGKWFTPHASVTVAYNIQENGPSDLNGTDTVTTDAEGHFVHAIPVTFAGDIQWVAIDATDLTSGAMGNAYL
jgi:hypothetical protein